MLCIHSFCVLSLLVRHFDGSEHPALQIVWIDNATRCRNSLLALFVHSLTDARLHLTGVDWPCHFGDAVQRRSRGLWFVTGRKKHLGLRRRTVIRSERPIDGLWVKAWIKARRRPFKTSFYTKNTYTNTQANSIGQCWVAFFPKRQKVTKGQNASEQTQTQPDCTVESE